MTRGACHFNPRARVGRDHGLHVIEERTRDFNPRARVGRDAEDNPTLQVLSISIHAPAWGATFRHFVRHRRDDISIHAPAWGATLGYFQVVRDSDISIHAPAWGATTG